jgi:hypothetical protein
VLIYIYDFFVCADEKQKKQKKSIFSSLPMTMALGKAGQQITKFSALPSVKALALGKEEISKKKKEFFVECRRRGTRQRGRHS